MAGSTKNLRPCFVCQEPAPVKAVKPKRYEDGRHRCQSCTRERIAGIIAYWQGAATAYPAEQNRGGISLVGGP
jgi:hypothetical protein